MYIIYLLQGMLAEYFRDVFIFVFELNAYSLQLNALIERPEKS